MSDQHTVATEETKGVAPAKRAWHAPTIEEIDYSETEAAGIPGALYDGIGTYSVI